jgi:hypothetical protein
MLLNIFVDPRRPYPNWAGNGWVLQIQGPLPDPVPVGHCNEQAQEIIDEHVPRDEYLERIQHACAEHGEAYEVRFYDHFETIFDAAILDRLSEIRALTIDPQCEIINPEAVARLPRLRNLALGPSGKQRGDLLAAMDVQRVETFTLGSTSEPRLDLSPLGESRTLKGIRILAAGRNMEAVGDCRSVTELSIQPTEKMDIGFIGRLEQLEVLKLSVGRLRSIEAIGPLPNLRDLSLFEVHTLEELGDLQRFPRLRRLQIDYQKRLKRLRVGSTNGHLEHINVSGIDEIEGFSELPALKSFNNFGGGFAPGWDQLPPTLTHFALPMPSLKKREKHFTDVRAHGYAPELHPDAQFLYK